MQRRQFHRDARPLEDRPPVARVRRGDAPQARRDRTAHNASRRAPCRPPRPACRRSSDSLLFPACALPSCASAMVRPSTNCLPSTRIAYITAWRMTGSPERATSFLTDSFEIPFRGFVELDDPPGQHQREGRGVDEQRIRLGCGGLPNRPSRSCRGSACRRSRCPARAAAPRPGTSAPRPPGPTANIPA